MPQDHAQALVWSRKAAAQGDAFAQFHLGFMYADGKGVPQDDAQALVWFRKAAEQGNAWRSFLGMMYKEAKACRRTTCRPICGSTWQCHALEMPVRTIGQISRRGRRQDDARADRRGATACERVEANEIVWPNSRPPAS